MDITSSGSKSSFFSLNLVTVILLRLKDDFNKFNKRLSCMKMPDAILIGRGIFMLKVENSSRDFNSLRV
jgi:hypothetical protein